MSEDVELQAIQQLLSALKDLDQEARDRVIRYVFQRLDLGPLAVGPSTHETQSSQTALSSEPKSPLEDKSNTASNAIVDIRSFAAKKRPSSQIEKTVLVAFYLAEVAPEEDRKSEISGADLTKYQKQADLGAPTNTRQALFIARDAGYLESAGHGKYKLNPVGYNFVAHGLPSESKRAQSTSKRRSTRKPGSKKASQKKRAKKTSRKKPSRSR